jgi:hypothetical protein
VTAARVAEVQRAGAAGVAVIRALLEHDDPARATKELLAACEEAWRRGPPVSSTGAGGEGGRPSAGTRADAPRPSRPRGSAPPLPPGVGGAGGEGRPE